MTSPSSSDLLSSDSTITWLNSVTSNCSTDDHLDQAVRSHSSHLQTISTETHRDAQRFMNRLLRVDNDLDGTTRDAEQLGACLLRIQSSERKEDEVFDTLKGLNVIRGNLLKCVRVLEERNDFFKWQKEVELFFQEKRLDEVAERLSRMRDSLDGMGKREDVVERLEHKLELLVRPGLEAALEDVDKGEYEALKRSVVVFAKLGRMEGLVEEVGGRRGKRMVEVCWEARNQVGGGRSPYEAFLERVATRLREVELVICQHAFATQSEIADVLATIVKYTFEQMSSTRISYGSNETTDDNTASCERFVLGYEASHRFVLDISASLIAHCSLETIKRSAVDATWRPFKQGLEKYLDWESTALQDELILALDAQQSALSSNVNDFLLSGLSPWELRLARLKADEVLEKLSEECASRCSRVELSGVIPVARLFRSHAETCYAFVKDPKRENTDAAHETDLMKTIAKLKPRFDSCIKQCSTVAIIAVLHAADQTVQEEQASMEIYSSRSMISKATAEARLKLFKVFVAPTIFLVEKTIANAFEPSTTSSASSSIVGPSDSITKAVDHLYSLIPLLDFDFASEDLLADSEVLGRSERDELMELMVLTANNATSTRISFGASTSLNKHQDESDDDLTRRISASWLEAVARYMCTAFVLRVAKSKRLSDKTSAQLGMDADCLEKNAGSVLAQGDLWDPALGVVRVVLQAAPGLTHLKLGAPFQYLDDRYARDVESLEALKALEHLLVALRNRS